MPLTAVIPLDGSEISSPLRISCPPVDTGMFPDDLHNNMKTTLSFSNPTVLESESLVAVVLDQSDPAQQNKGDKNKDKPQLKVATTDAAVQSAAADLLASGEVTGKPFEINLLHKPAGLKAKR